jgi:ribosomal protein S20
MAITSSAKKALRAAKKKRVFNLRRKSAVENEVKELRKFLAAKDKAGALKLIPSLYQALDKAVKTKYMKANTSSRLKSRAMKAIKKLA